METFNSRIQSIAESHYMDYVGFADLRTYEQELVDSGGIIVKGYPSGISLGLVLPDAIVDYLPEREDNNIACEYRVHGYDVFNIRLNIVASVISSYLNRQGYRTLPIAAADRTDRENAIPTVSHKTIAHIAGLGWIGKNCLLVTPEHGPRIRLISILTEAPLDTVNNPLEQRCNDCNKCMTICPVNAIKGRNFKLGESREYRLDVKKCDDYFKSMAEMQEYAICGLCLYVCPHGKTK
jgi:epoxyqueuosine reductase